MSMYGNRGEYLQSPRSSAHPARGSLLNTTLSMLGGAAVGAAIMYLFDPDNGQGRRDNVTHYTGDALKGTGQTLGLTAAQLAEKVKDLSQSIASGISTGTAGATSATSDAYNSIADRTASLFGHQRQTNDQWLGDVESHDKSMNAPLFGATAVGSTLAAVIGLYMLDPEKRRVMLDAVHKIVDSTGETFHSLGKQFVGATKPKSTHMDYATSEDYVDYTSTSDPDSGRAGNGPDSSPQGT